MRTMLRSFAITSCAAAVTVGLVPLASAAHAATADPAVQEVAATEATDEQALRSVVPSVEDQQTVIVQTDKGLEESSESGDPGTESQTDPADEVVTPDPDPTPEPSDQTDPVTEPVVKPVTPVKKKKVVKKAKKRVPLVYSGGRVMTVGRTVNDRATIASLCPRTPVRGYVYSSFAYTHFNGLCRRSVAEAYSSTAARAIVYAFRALGSRYSQGNRSGVRSYDCSSLVSRAYFAAGNRRMMVGRGWWPTTYSLMGGQGGAYRVKGGRAGDIVFPNSGHVALRIAGGFIIHASNPSTGIKLSSIYSRVASYRSPGR